MGVSKDVPEFCERKLMVFARNCELFAERVAAGQLRLIDAADMLQSAAELSGLCEIAGDVNGGAKTGQRGGVKVGQWREDAPTCKGARSGPFACRRRKLLRG
jgi:hypothetical protein